MRIVLFYIHVTGSPAAAALSHRFVQTQVEHPGLHPHDLVVICNGGPLDEGTKKIFAPLNARYLPRANDPGWDVSAFLDAGNIIGGGYDMILCCGESIHFHRAGWLNRFAEAAEKHGPGMYGAFSSNAVRPHLNTTCFFIDPQFLCSYPHTVRCKRDRYDFEHGPTPLWRRLHNVMVPVRLVTWDGEWEPKQWRGPLNIMWRGDQSNCLVWNNHCERWFKAMPATRARWSQSADRAFR